MAEAIGKVPGRGCWRGKRIVEHLLGPCRSIQKRNRRGTWRSGKPTGVIRGQHIGRSWTRRPAGLTERRLHGLRLRKRRNGLGASAPFRRRRRSVCHLLVCPRNDPTGRLAPKDGVGSNGGVIENRFHRRGNTGQPSGRDATINESCRHSMITTCRLRYLPPGKPHLRSSGSSASLITASCASFAAPR